MGRCSCSRLSGHQGFCIFFGLWSGIAGIVALTLNNKSQCAESYTTLMVLGIGFAAFSLFYFINCFILQEAFLWLVGISGIFVFVLDCMLIDDIARGNQSDDCSGGRGHLRLGLVVSTVPFLLIACGVCLDGPDVPHTDAGFFGTQKAEFQTLLL